MSAAIEGGLGTVEMDERTAYELRRWHVGLTLGLLLVLAALASYGTRHGDVLSLCVGVYGTVLSIIGALAMPARLKRIWWAFAISQAAFTLGDLMHGLQDLNGMGDQFPSPADVAYLLGYPTMALGAVWLVRSRRRGHDWSAFLDAAIAASVLAVLMTVFFVAPAAEAAGGTGRLGQVIAAAYPAGDIIVAAMAFRLVSAGLVRNSAMWALMGAFWTLLAADLAYLVTVAVDAPYNRWIGLGFQLSYVLLGAAALHPSARALSEPALERDRPIRVGRVIWLGLALMTTPLMDQLAHSLDIEEGRWAILPGGVIVAALLVWRLWDLLSELQSNAVQLAALAHKDDLTGVPNRRTWEHELSRGCAEARDQGTPLTVAMLDLDRFKAFNDTHGHLPGDKVLTATAAAWSSLLDGRGFLARYGGEEFAVLLPRMTTLEAEVILDELRRAVTHGQTCSIGAATWNGIESPATLVSRADQALYHAKDWGRDQVAVHRSGTVVPAAREQRAVPVLPELKPVFQPIVDLESGKIVGAEALSRFQEGDPREIFRRAVMEGITAALEAAAIRAAVEAWHRPGRLALNCSLSTLVTPEVQDALPEDLSRIDIEISESDLVDYGPAVMLALDAVRVRGARIAVDDFGVGFSNVQRIATVQPDIIKIDRSLIHGIDSDPMLQAGARSCAYFAEQIGAEVVAEGIETAAELECVRSLGIGLGQGYLLGRPKPLSDWPGGLTVVS